MTSYICTLSPDGVETVVIEGSLFDPENISMNTDSTTP